ncbi:MAG: hypothetical protein QOF71_1735 [Candidatus Eremiobacteraeota bacterium]|jgi:hypothetical protein|nr:hypothetical protein [Candidatus Eremiobacteraeota bacterium]
MQMTRAWSAFTVALVVAAAVPVAAADDGAALTAKIDGAISGAASYRVTVQGPNGFAIDIVSVGRDRVRVQSSAGGNSAESVVVGPAMYYRTAGSPWTANVVPVVRTPRKNLLYMGAPDTKVEPLADRTEGGVAYGAFGSLAVGNAQVPATMECTYDKATYRPHACTVVLQALPTPLHVTYDKWDDPSNVVDVPPGVPPPTPPPVRPAPSPSPRVPQ